MSWLSETITWDPCLDSFIYSDTDTDDNDENQIINRESSIPCISIANNENKKKYDLRLDYSHAECEVEKPQTKVRNLSNVPVRNEAPLDIGFRNMQTSVRTYACHEMEHNRNEDLVSRLEPSNNQEDTDLFDNILAAFANNVLNRARDRVSWVEHIADDKANSQDFSLLSDNDKNQATLSEDSSSQHVLFEPISHLKHACDMIVENYVIPEEVCDSYPNNNTEQNRDQHEDNHADDEELKHEISPVSSMSLNEIHKPVASDKIQSRESDNSNTNTQSELEAAKRKLKELQRVQEEAQFERRKLAVTAITRHVLWWLSAKQFVPELEKARLTHEQAKVIAQRQKAAQVIQSCFLMWITRKKHLSVFNDAKELKQKASRIHILTWIHWQAHCRGFILRQSMQQSLQKAFITGKQHYQVQCAFETRSAIRIQASWRGFWFRKAVLPSYQQLAGAAVTEMVLKNDAATKLQAVARGFQGRSRVRCLLADFKEARNHYTRRMECASIISRTFYAYFILCKFRPQLDQLRRNKAATCIQAVTRGFLARRYKVKVLQAVSRIQAVWRGYRLRLRLEHAMRQLTKWHQVEVENEDSIGDEPLFNDLEEVCDLYGFENSLVQNTNFSKFCRANEDDKCLQRSQSAGTASNVPKHHPDQNCQKKSRMRRCTSPDVKLLYSWTDQQVNKRDSLPPVRRPALLNSTSKAPLQLGDKSEEKVRACTRNHHNKVRKPKIKPTTVITSPVNTMNSTTVRTVTSQDIARLRRHRRAQAARRMRHT